MSYNCYNCPFKKSAINMLDVSSQNATDLINDSRTDVVTISRIMLFTYELARARMAIDVCSGPIGDLETLGHQRCTNNVAIKIGSKASKVGLWVD